MRKTSAENVEGRKEDIPTEEITNLKPKTSSNHQNFRILGMPQRTMDANLSLAHKCASMTCQNIIESWHTNYQNRRWNDELGRPISATLMNYLKEREKN